MSRLHAFKSAALLLTLNTVFAMGPLAQSQEIETTPPPPATGDTVKCPQYKVYYIDPATQFFTPPVPIEDHAEFVFCSDHKKLDELRARLKTMKPIRSHADIDTARIKVVPKGRPDDAITFCSTGELTFRGKQYRLDRRFFERLWCQFRPKATNAARWPSTKKPKTNASSTNRPARRKRRPLESQPRLHRASITI